MDSTDHFTSLVKLPTYPSPKPKSVLTFHLGQNVGLGGGRRAVFQKRISNEYTLYPVDNATGFPNTCLMDCDLFNFVCGLKQSQAMADPDLQIREGAPGHPNPEVGVGGGGPVSK